MLLPHFEMGALAAELLLEQIDQPVWHRRNSSRNVHSSCGIPPANPSTRHIRRRDQEMNMKLLITGATGKVGTRLIAHLEAALGMPRSAMRALCHTRSIAGIEAIHGTIADRACVARAMEGVTHVIHMATCKETPDHAMDVTVRGLFWMLEEFRQSKTARQFILIGGDAAVGHFFYDHGAPVTEQTPHMAYPGHALSRCWRR